MDLMTIKMIAELGAFGVLILIMDRRLSRIEVSIDKFLCTLTSLITRDDIPK